MAEDDKASESNDLLTEIENRYRDARDHASKWREQARECFRFYADDQWDEKDIAKLQEQGRPVVTFNRTKRLVNAVIGHEANNRAEVRYIPRTMGDAKVNELLTNAGAYFRDQCDAEHEESDAFRDMIICGMGWTNDRLTDADNPDYDLIEERVDPMEMLWDAAAKKPNLADARYLFRRKRYTEKEVKTIWPDFKGPFTSAFGDETDDLEAQPHESNPRGRYGNDNDGSANDVRPDVLVLEYQYKERDGYYEITEMSSDDGQPSKFNLQVEGNEDLIERLKKSGVPMVFKRRTVTRRCFVIGRTIVQGPDVVCPHDFTYHCITGYRDRERNHWHGIVHSLLDPQRWSNKWLAQIMHILNSNAKGGLMAEESAILDRQQFEATWADPAAVTYFADGALKDGRVVPKTPPVMMTGVEKLLEYANTSFTDVSGVNQELLGLADREQPGVLEWQRKQSAVTLLAPLFDSLRRFRKMQGRVWLYMMQKYVSDGRIIRITIDQPNGQKLEQNVPLQLPPEWKNPETAQFDVIVDQSSSAPNQKEQTWAIISQLASVAKEMFLHPPVMLWALKYSPLPSSAFEELQQIAAQEAQNPKPDPEMAKVQAEVQAKQQEMQIKQAEGQMKLQLEREKAEMELAIEREKMKLEVEKANQQMELERMKAGNQLQVESMKAEAQQQQMQQQMVMDRERAEFDAGLDQQKMDRETRMAEHQMGLESKKVGMKGELDAAKNIGEGPISKLLSGISKSSEGSAASTGELTKVLSQLAKQLGDDSAARNSAISQILKRRGGNGRAN